MNPAERRSIGPSRVELGVGEVRAMTDLVEQAWAPLRRRTETTMLDALFMVRSRVPASIGERIGHAHRNGAPVVVVSVPDDGRLRETRPSPVDGLPDADNVTAADGVHHLVAAQLGIPYGFSSQQSGRIINQVVPLREHRDVANVNSGSGQSFDLHTEDAVHDARPDFLTLRCVRNPDRVPTIVSRVWPTDLSDPDWELLREAAFEQVANPSQGGSRLRRRLRSPLVSGPRQHPELRVNTCVLRAEHVLTPSHFDAYLRLRAALEANAVQVVASPGDIMVLDNAVYVHGRTAFAPRFDGSDRWLRRIIVRKSFKGLGDVLVPGTKLVRRNEELKSLTVAG